MRTSSVSQGWKTRGSRALPRLKSKPFGRESMPGRCLPLGAIQRRRSGPRGRPAPSLPVHRGFIPEGCGSIQGLGCSPIKAVLWESRTLPGLKLESSPWKLGAFAFEGAFRYAENRNCSVRHFFQFVLVASASGQLPVGRVCFLRAILHVAWLQRALLRNSAMQ
jgi:hypothetical protein